MITELRMAFRHFREVDLRSLTGVNIIVGPNNAGKTSIFRGIQKLTSEHPQSTTGSLTLGTTITFPHLSRITISDRDHFSRQSQEVSSLIQWWRKDWGKFEQSYISNADDDEYSRIESDLKTEVCFYAQLPSVDPAHRDSQPSETQIAKHRVAHAIGTIRSQQRSWRDNLYFLWHRRKSLYEEQLGAFHGRLDDEAEHLAGRLDHLLTGTGGGSLRAKLNRFMNAVIPGIGEIGIRRRQAEPDGKTLISVIFSNGREDRTLDELGGGVEQTLALATVLLGEKDEGAVFIEEPESHLHESAQRRLIDQIIHHRGARQIFIATHSAVFVNEFPAANVYRVSRAPDGNASVHACLDRASQRGVLNELGVLPSSLTQTNCVLWVEGPTETRLVRYWLSLIAPELKVHQHYEFAETGGSNLGSLAADILLLDEDDDEPIETADTRHLRDIMRICRHNFLICDRDAGIGENPSKDPVQAIESLVGEHHYWVTRGYEIEWYLPPAVIGELWGQAAITHMAGCATANEPFHKRLAASGLPDTKTTGKRKVQTAERAVKMNLSADIWFAGPMGEDLRENIDRIAAFIREANQMTATASNNCNECGQPSPHC